MKMLPFVVHTSQKKVDRLTAIVWLVAKEQARMGHQVTLLFNSAPDEAAKAVAEEI